MRGIQGLIIAVGLGFAGMLFNWAYQDNKAKDVQMVYFLGIAKDATVDRGEKLTDDKLVSVGVPRASVGNLEKFAFPLSTKPTVIGSQVWRNLEGPALLLQDDLKTPPNQLVFGEKLGEGREERAMPIPIDPSRFVPSLVEPGCMVSFVFPKYSGPTPAPAVAPAARAAPAEPPEAADPADAPLTPTPETSFQAPLSADSTEIIGPFKILALGNRLGKTEVMRAAKIAQVQENVVLISVTVVGDKLDAKAQKLWALLQEVSPQHMGVLLHPPKR